MNALVELDEALLAEAFALTGAKDRSALLDRALRALVEQEARRQDEARHRAFVEGLRALGGSDPDASAPPRRRFE